MNVIQTLRTTGEPAPSSVEAAQETGLDRDAVELFLRGQCTSLRHGLANRGDANVVRLVLASHETSHPCWVGLIAAADRYLDAHAAQALAALYTGHGRVVGALERGPEPALSAEVAARVDILLADNLADLTETAVAALA